jgi:hypothetical protein
MLIRMTYCVHSHPLHKLCIAYTPCETFAMPVVGYHNLHLQS